MQTRQIVKDPATMERFPIEGAELQMRSVGEGPPVLLLHGIPGDHRTLAPVADALAEGFRALTLSMRHAGHGAAGTRPFGTGQQLEDLVDLVDMAGLAPVHLVAWSYSAHAAMAFASEFPRRVRSLFLYEPGFPTFVTDPAVQERIQTDTYAAFSPVFEALSQPDPKAEAAVRAAIDGAAGQPGWFDGQPEALRRIHLDNAHLLPLLTRQTPPLDLREDDLRRITCPTTVAWGGETRPCYRLTSQACAEAIGDWQLVVPGQGHLLPEAAPGQFASLLRDHLASASG